MMIDIAPHPRLEPGLFITRFAEPLSAAQTPGWLAALLTPGAVSPLSVDETVRAAVRDVLRGFGFKPTGRNKPASEYLARAVADGSLAAINLAVDACNAVSLASGLPISVVDLDRTRPPLSVALGKVGESYVFNASGQVIEVAGLPCLCDAEGPCANAVKDSQRTKTTGSTICSLSVVWGAKALGDRTSRVVEWYRELLERAGAQTTPAEIASEAR
jgi:DNA/RNA-binding domain of Phe-tRNA-synthetase-like protein